MRNLVCLTDFIIKEAEKNSQYVIMIEKITFAYGQKCCLRIHKTLLN